MGQVPFYMDALDLYSSLHLSRNQVHTAFTLNISSQHQSFGSFFSYPFKTISSLPRAQIYHRSLHPVTSIVPESLGFRRNLKLELSGVLAGVS
jgi:hypothetical protein